MEVYSASMAAKVVSIGRELARVCDSLGQTIAGNHISFGVEVLAAAVVVEHSSGGDHGLGNQIETMLRQLNEASTPIVRIVDPL